ncbi:MAG TPA: hypothetical protein DCM40_40015 [Maribacter sp.]|nr:hypothetical protein [Maribacter sp.]
MSEEKKVKWLHEFEVNKTVKKEVSEDGKDESGEPIKITKQIEEKVPVKFCLKRPNRRLYEDADLFYGVRLSEGIKEGLLTKTLLAKRFSNDGGTMSESEKDNYATAYEKLAAVENKIQRAQINLEKISEKEKTEKIRELMKEAIELRYDLQSIENEQSSLFDQTAESRAKNKTILWWVLFLSFMDEEGERVPVFGDGIYEEKLAKYDEYEEDDNLFWNEAIRKLAYYVSFWESGQVESPEDFQGIDNIFAEAEKTETEEGENPKPKAKKRAPKKKAKAVAGN